MPSLDGDPLRQRILAGIEARGWHSVLVPDGKEGPGFGYTVGLFKTHSHPELAVVGLPIEVGQHLLDTLAERIAKGARYESGRPYSGLIERFPCVFRTIHPSYFAGYFGQASRFYGEVAFPVLQCIYPDREGRFSWQPEVDPDLVGRQLLLDSPWPFRAPRSLAAITLRSIVEGLAPIKLVTHDGGDGAWQFVDGAPTSAIEDARIVSLEEVFKLDPSVGEVADLPIGWSAERAGPGMEWRRFPTPPDEPGEGEGDLD